MTRISVAAASVRLNDLIRRAEAGEEVVLTREGQDVVSLHPVQIVRTAADRARVIERAHAALHDVVFDETCAARSQDFLYDEDGLPA